MFTPGRHRWVVIVAGLVGVTALVSFRTLIELGFGPPGSLRVFGIPLEYVWLTWFLVLWAVASDRQKVFGADRARAIAYERWLGVIGLAVTFWLMQTVGPYRLFVLEAWVYPIASVSAFAIFLSTTMVERCTVTASTSTARRDALRILRRPVTWVSAAGVIGVLTAAPRSFEIPIEGSAFRRWYSGQMRQNIPAAWTARPVTLVEFIDYQCPACREAASRYSSVIREAEITYGELFGVVRIDFPLDGECNSFVSDGPHPAACEAAAAVRLARADGSEREGQVVAWLWKHQAQLTPDKVLDGIVEEFGLDVRARYGELLQAIRHDVAEATRLGVSGTPTYFLNGRRLPLLPASTLQTALEIEAERARQPGEPRDESE